MRSFLQRHQARRDGQMCVLANTLRGEYMFTKSLALTLRIFLPFLPIWTSNEPKSHFLPFLNSAPPDNPFPPGI